MHKAIQRKLDEDSLANSTSLDRNWSVIRPKVSMPTLNVGDNQLETYCQRIFFILLSRHPEAVAAIKGLAEFHSRNFYSATTAAKAFRAL